MEVLSFSKASKSAFPVALALHQSQKWERECKSASNLTTVEPSIHWSTGDIKRMQRDPVTSGELVFQSQLNDPQNPWGAVKLGGQRSRGWLETHCERSVAQFTF